MSKSRTYSLTYAGLTIGGASDTYLLDSAIETVKDYRTLVVSCTVLVRADTEVLLEIARDALEAAFRKPYRDLTVVRGTNTTTYSQSDNSGFNQSAEASRDPQEGESDRLCYYQVAVKVELPADNAGDNGLSELNSRITTDVNGRYLLEFDGEYTAIGGNSAQEQYLQEIGALTTTLQDEAEAGLTWDVQMASYERDFENKRVQFAHNYIESTDREKQDGTDDSEIRNSDTTISVGLLAKNLQPFPSQRQPQMLVIEYSCQFVRTSNIEDTESALRTKWKTVILPNLQDRVENYLKTFNDVITYTYADIRVNFNLRRPGLSARIEVLAADGPIIEGAISEARSALPPWDLVAMHDKNRYSKVVAPSIGSAFIAHAAMATIQTDSRSDAETIALSLLPPFPDKALFGFGTSPIKFKPRHELIKPAETHDWNIELDEHIEDDVSFDVRGPFYMGAPDLRKQIATWKVQVTRSAEYFTRKRSRGQVAP